MLQEPKAMVEEEESIQVDRTSPNRQGPSSSQEPQSANPHLAFEKNYPKNIFIPLIQHLNQIGHRKSYEACVGTRESFEGKNVVSLAEIYKVLSQEWFIESINLGALVSNMSNKILMNSKIKKKLFHLLLVKELFTISLEEGREFKKIVSKRACEISQSKLPTDILFDFPSALIYLLNLFANGLSAMKPESQRMENEGISEEELLNNGSADNRIIDNRSREKQISSKEQYKSYVCRIVAFFNAYHGEPSELLDAIEQIKADISIRERQIRQKYNLGAHVPQWSYFSSIVISNCYLQKRSRSKLTFSMINGWIQEFKQKTISLAGFLDLQEEQEYRFKPIVLIFPPQ